MTGARYRQLASELRERIALGDYGPQGALESESELAARYAVSRVTVRKALEQLRDDGLVGSRKGAGWYVASDPIGQSLALGSFVHAASAVADAGLTISRRVVEYGFLPAPADVAATLDIAAGTELLRAHSVRRAGDEPLDTVVEWVPEPAAAHISRADAADVGIWEAMRRLGHTVSTVRQSIAAVAATARAAELLAVTEGAPLLLIRRLAVGTDGVPLALSDHRYLGHRFRLDVEFRGWPATSATEPPGLRQAEAARPNRRRELQEGTAQ